MLARKDKVVKELTDGIRHLFKQAPHRGVHRHGKPARRRRSQVARSDGGRTSIEAGHILLATGSEPVKLPFLPFDGKAIVDSTGCACFHAGARSPRCGRCRLYRARARLRVEAAGLKVTVLEFLPRIVPTTDAEMGESLRKSLAKQGLEIHLETKVTGAKVDGGRATVSAEKNDKSQHTFDCERVLVAVGRRPLTEGLGLADVGVNLDARTGKVPVDSQFRTNVPTISAIGDLIEGPMLAHKAEDEGIAFCEMLAGKSGHVNYDTVPGVIYTWPELASVGLSEEQAKERGLKYRVGKFPFLANGRAKAMDETEGLVKILADAVTDRVLGVHILGPRAVGNDRRGGRGDGVRRLCRRHRADLPRASHNVRSDSRGGAGS